MGDDLPDGYERTEDIEAYREQDPDPQLDPTRSPGFGTAVPDLSEIDVGRDVTLGEADPEELTAADTEPMDDDGPHEVVDRLRGGTPTERRRAALALAERPPSAASRAALRTAAREDDDADVRQFAVEALGKVGGERAAETALALTDDPEPWVRAEAYVTLDRLDRGAHEAAIEAGLDDDHHAVRRNAAISLFKLRGTDLADTLLELSADDSERVREWAAHLLGGVDSAAATERLERLAAEDPSDVVRRTAENAIETDPGSFRRQFGGAIDATVPEASKDDTLNRRPDL